MNCPRREPRCADDFDYDYDYDNDNDHDHDHGSSSFLLAGLGFGLAFRYEYRMIPCEGPCPCGALTVGATGVAAKGTVCAHFLHSGCPILSFLASRRLAGLRERLPEPLGA